MRQQRAAAAPAPARATRAPIEPLTSGYALVVDGQMKTEFKTKGPALKAARDLKGRFPMIQVKVYDAEEKRTEEIELAAARA
jgi:PP-loop superfamily ATP-utilizing enzyme